VSQGVITLTGVVEDRHQKRVAEEIALSVMGVDDVLNELKVRHGFLARVTGEKAPRES
jgi:osmotically-inducible protein OsmY